MNKKWNEKSFGDCAKLIKDPYQPSENESVPYIGLEHIEQNTLRLTSIGNSSKVVSQKFKFRQNDILFGKLRPYFRKVVQPDVDGVCSTDIFVVRAKSGIEQDFLYYWMASQDFVDYSSKGSEGTKMPRAKWEFLERFARFVPDIDEQASIANILKSFDKKIQNLILQNEILEKIIHVLFTSWFIDFDGQTEFVDSELGKIPRGWRVEYFGNVVTITDFGTSGSFASLKENIVFYYKPEYAILVRAVDFNNNWNGNYVYTDKHGYEFSRKGNLEPGDIMLSNIGNVGTPFFVPDLGKSMTCGKNVLLLKMEQFKKNFIFFYMSSNIGQNVINSILTGSAVPKFNKTDLKNTKLVYPTEEIIKKFDRITSPLRKNIQILENEQRKILELRDILLPKLMSGQIKVKN